MPLPLLLLLVLLLGAPILQAQQIEKLHNDINTVKYHEYSPIVSRDGHTLYFTRVGSPDFSPTLMLDSVDLSTGPREYYEEVLQDAYSQISGKPVKSPVDSEFNQDVWVAESLYDFFDEVSHPGPPLNNALPNSILAITDEPNEFIVINQFPERGGMKEGFSLIRQYLDGSWTVPQPLQIRNYYSKSRGVNLTLSKSGDVLILSLERGDSNGETDLYICFLENDGTWTEPRNLGPLVNSIGRDMHPYLSEDMEWLFFASDRPGASRVDIYVTQRLSEDWKTWTVPKRLSPPINSPFDDGQPYFNEATGFLYFSSNRDGSSDIFRTQYREPKGQQEVLLAGRILNSETGEPVTGRIYFGTDSTQMNNSFYHSADGRYRIKVPKGQPVYVYVEKDGYLGHIYEISLNAEEYLFQPPSLDMKVDPLRVDAKISVQPIFFERSKPTILPGSTIALLDLYRILSEHPGMRIRIEGHTDNIGPREALLELSQQRADAVRDYLAGRGIDPKRIEARGYGPDKPINNNTSEEQRELNRRVEVRITSLE